MPTAKITPNIERIKRDIDRLAEFTLAGKNVYTRFAFSKEDADARHYLMESMQKEAGLTVHMDAAGNLIGRKAGHRDKKNIIIGSHIDTVRDGGRFDGMAGVISGLEVARMFHENNLSLDHSLEIIIFVAEEPALFGLSTIGSRAVAGILPPEALDLKEEGTGRKLADAISYIGGDPEHIADARKSSQDVIAYLELHIEQGHLLFSRNIPIGIVSGIVGIYRGSIEISGQNDHAGTTPMDARRDALAAASEAVLVLEEICHRNERVVGTIGNMVVSPNALNIVPGTVKMGLDLRSIDTEAAVASIRAYEDALENIGKKRAVTIERDIFKSSDPTLFPAKLIDRMKQACRDIQIPYLETVSWAGHDAMHMAKIVPAGMIFIPSREGRSHCPEEFSEIEHIALGCRVLAEAVDSFD